MVINRVFIFEIYYIYQSNNYFTFTLLLLQSEVVIRYHC